MKLVEIRSSDDCSNWNTTDRFLLIEPRSGVSITLPSYKEFAVIMHQMSEHNASFEDAYKAADWTWGILPPLTTAVPPISIRPCIRQAYLMPGRAGELLGPGQWTLEAVWKCFEMYGAGKVESSGGRMKIAEGVYTPSYNEWECITKALYTTTGSLSEAYRLCNCESIIPGWLGAEECILNLIRTTELSGYTVTKVCYDDAVAKGFIAPPGVLVPSVTTPATTPPVTPTEDKWLVYALIGLAAILLIEDL